MKIEFINFLPDLTRRSYVYPMLGIPIVAALTPDDIEITTSHRQKGEDFPVADTDAVAMSVLTHQAPYVYSIAQQYREKGKKVILGGIHPSVLPDEALRYADAVVIGEAELVWEQVISDLKKGTLKKTYKSKDFVSMDMVPNARIDLMDNKNYHNRAVLHASRGCPFFCSFCSVTEFFGNTYRFRPISKVINEAQGFISQNLAAGNNIIFNDDNIACNKKYARELFLELKKLNITWSGQANLFIGDDPELLKLAAESGCVSLFVGIESLIAENLKDINKSMNHIGKYEEAIKKIHDAGIAIIGSIILGLDHDDESVFDKTLEFIDRNDIEMPSFSVLTPFPGTKIYSELEQQGRIIDKDWGKYDMGNVVYVPKLMTPEKLQENLDYVYNATAFRRSRGSNRIANKSKTRIIAKEVVK